MSTPPLSTNTPPLSPEPPTRIAETPATLAFQSTLPHLLQPLSPELSALHAARIRLLLDLPVGSSRGWSCTRCGWLRDEFGWKVVKVKPERAVKAAGAAGKKGGGRRKGEADISMPEEPSSTPADQATRSSTAHPVPQPKIGIGARKPCPAPRARQKATCPLCGSAISLRPPSATTKAEFPSTRRTRAIVGAGGVLPSANGIEVGTSVRATITSQDGSERKADEAMDFASTGIQLTSPPPTEHITASGKPIISNPIKSSPKLAYIALTDPEPASESLPSLTPSALPAPSEERPAGVRNAVGYLDLGPVGGKGKGKGRKQSGLKTSTVAPAAESKPAESATARKAGSQPNNRKTTPKTTEGSATIAKLNNTTTTPPPSTAKPTALPTPAPSLATARGAPPKKKQKTGLAKLLADSKAREQQENEKKKGVGILSLGGDWEL